jgi:hypothetical protein
LAATAGLLLALAGSAAAAVKGGDRRPWIAYVHPAGGSAGTTLELLLGGQFVEDARGVVVTGEGVTAAILPPVPPADPEAEERRRQRLRNTAFVENLRLRLTIADHAPPGDRVLRLVTDRGLSNPRTLRIDRLATVVEPTDPEGGAPGAAGRKPGRRPVEVAGLPAALHGRILTGGETDRYAFTGRRGQRLVATATTRGLIPFIADAVPGWFQASLTLLDPTGREIAYADHRDHDQDPVLTCELPANGTYVLAITDALSRGREDFVYRLAIGELPLITSHFPLGGRRGTGTLALDLTGWHLTAPQLLIPRDPPWTGPVAVDAGSAGPAGELLPVAFDDLPEIREDEAATGSDGWQRISWPGIVNGRIRRPGEEDVYAFPGTAGEKVRLAVDARRLGSPLDALLILRDEAGQVLAVDDDAAHQRVGTATHQADPALVATLPATGRYTATVLDVQDHGGEDFSYRLRLERPVPGFRLYATPSAVIAPPGGSAAITIQVHRDPGCDGPIALTATAPLALDGGLIPAGADHLVVSLRIPVDASPGLLVPRLLGLAHSGDTELAQPVVFCEDQMQAFLWRHLVPAEPAVVVDDQPALLTLRPRLPAAGVLALAPGGQAAIDVAVTRTTAGRGRRAKLILIEAPTGITLEGGMLPPGRPGGNAVLRATAETPPGRHHLRLAAMVQLDPLPETPAPARPAAAPPQEPADPARSPAATDQKKTRPRFRVVEGPVMPVEVGGAPPPAGP